MNVSFVTMLRICREQDLFSDNLAQGRDDALYLFLKAVVKMKLFNSKSNAQIGCS